MAGHIQRHMENMSWAVINYRDQAWWRARQLNIKSGPSDLRHPARYRIQNWETDLENFWKKRCHKHLVDKFYEDEQYEPQCWGHLALNREVWRRACVENHY